MESDDLVAHARSLRARGTTPKGIAKALGITRAEADALVRQIARESSAEAAVVGCWMNAGWSQGLSWSDHPEWHEGEDDEDDDDDDEDDDDGYGDGDDDDDGGEIPQLVSVLVVREHRYQKLSACSYLVDAQCLGVKDAFGPRVLDRTELDAFVARHYEAYHRAPLRVPLELARELVFGAEAYARTLGFEPHRDFERCRGQLGAWSGPSPIVFGYHGKPFLVGAFGPKGFEVAAVEPGPEVDGTGSDEQGRWRQTRGRAFAGGPGGAEAPFRSYVIPPVHVTVRKRGPVPADAPRGDPTTPVSDSLLRVMEPYISWPPATDEIDVLGEELSFGATVWNATAQSTDPTKTAALLEAVIGMFSTGEPGDEASLRAQVVDIAERKRRLYPDDPRQIVRVDVVPRGGNVEVVAMSAWYPSTARRRDDGRA